MTPLHLHVIRARREEMNLTQQQLADAVEVSRATINRMENQRLRTIDLDVLERLARVLEMRPGSLISEEPAPKPRRKR